MNVEIVRSKWLQLSLEQQYKSCSQLQEYLRRRFLFNEQAYFKYEESPKQMDLEEEILDYLVCPLSLEILREPCCTQMGNTYEKAMLEECIQKQGPKDPLTSV